MIQLHNHVQEDSLPDLLNSASFIRLCQSCIVVTCPSTCRCICNCNLYVNSAHMTTDSNQFQVRMPACWAVAALEEPSISPAWAPVPMAPAVDIILQSVGWKVQQQGQRFAAAHEPLHAPALLKTLQQPPGTQQSSKSSVSPCRVTCWPTLLVIKTYKYVNGDTLLDWPKSVCFNNMAPSCIKADTLADATVYTDTPCI